MMWRPIVSALAFALATGCSTPSGSSTPGGGDDQPGPGPDASAEVDASTAPDANEPMIDAPIAIDAPAQVIALRSAYWSSAAIAVDANGLRATYKVNGVVHDSAINFAVFRSGQADCHVQLRPAFVAFGVRADSGRQVKMLRLDPGAGTILTNDCGIANSTIQTMFAALGVIEVGLINAGPGFYPRLDLIAQGMIWGGPSYVTHTNYQAQAIGHAMDATGVVNMSAYAIPEANSVVAGLYEWLPI